MSILEPVPRCAAILHFMSARTHQIVNPYRSVERIRVRYGETDQMGHAYYANYLFWFEQARGRWCRDRGFAYADLEKVGYFLPVVEAHTNYRDQVLYDDWIQIHVWVTEIRRATVRFEYEVINERTGAASTSGHTIHVLVGNERKTVSISGEIKEMLLRDPRECVALD